MVLTSVSAFEVGYSAEHVQLGVEKRDLKYGGEVGEKGLRSKLPLLFHSSLSYFSPSSLHLTTIKI